MSRFVDEQPQLVDGTIILIEPIRSLSGDVVPQAIIGLPIAKVIGHRTDISSGNDDFDYFEEASFKLDGKIEIAVRHYRGHPANTATLYIDRSAHDIAYITMLIRKVLSKFDIPDTALTWERRINPEL